MSQRPSIRFSDLEAAQCYRIALAIIEVGSEALVLVHGRVAGIEHAWISLDDGRIYDPVAHALINSANYPAVIDHRYTKPEALAMATEISDLWALVSAFTPAQFYLSRKNDDNEKRFGLGCGCCSPLRPRERF